MQLSPASAISMTPVYPEVQRISPPPRAYRSASIYDELPFLSPIPYQGPECRQRTAVACQCCRQLKVRCCGFEDASDGRCKSCSRLRLDCVFAPMSSQGQDLVPAHAAYPHMKNSLVEDGFGRVCYNAPGQPLPPQQQPTSPHPLPQGLQQQLAPPHRSQQPASPRRLPQGLQQQPAPPHRSQQLASPRRSQQPAPPHPLPQGLQQQPASPHQSQQSAPPHRSQQPASPHQSQQPAPPHRSQQPASPHRSQQPASPHQSQQPAPPHRSQQPASPRRSQQPAPPHPLPQGLQQQPASPHRSQQPAPPHQSQQPAPPRRLPQGLRHQPYGAPPTPPSKDRDMQLPSPPLSHAASPRRHSTNHSSNKPAPDCVCCVNDKLPSTSTSPSHSTRQRARQHYRQPINPRENWSVRQRIARPIPHHNNPIRQRNLTIRELLNPIK